MKSEKFESSPNYPKKGQNTIQMNPRILRSYWLLSAVLTIQIALATQFVYLPAFGLSSRNAEIFPNVLAEMEQIDLMPK